MKAMKDIYLTWKALFRRRWYDPGSRGYRLWLVDRLQEYLMGMSDRDRYAWSVWVGQEDDYNSSVG